jgi:hypothetical protein
MRDNQAHERKVPSCFAIDLNYFSLPGLNLQARGEPSMRAFIAACLAIVVIAGAGYYATNMIQVTSTAAYTSTGARI